MEAVTVLSPGSPIKLAGEIHARILSVMIRGQTISYEVVWWDGRTRHEAWVNEMEVETQATTRTLRVGF